MLLTILALIPDAPLWAGFFAVVAAQEWWEIAR